ncbi:MAG: glutamine amidotransferase [Variovorax sp.]
MRKKRVLLAGESWTSTAVHIKGWDQFPTATHHRGADAFVALLASDFAITYMLCHEAVECFPSTAEGLDAYDCIILSDIGANSLLLPPEVWIHSRRAPNRLKLLRDYVLRGGGLIMVGGYYSFQGINGAARFRNTPVEQVLPVSIHPFDDRLELPEGIVPQRSVGADGHDILKGVAGAFPYLLGINEVVVKDGATELLALPQEEGGHPLLVVHQAGEGRSAAWTTDIGPHWLPNEFLHWKGFQTLWRNLILWTSGENTAPASTKSPPSTKKASKPKSPKLLRTTSAR